MKIHGRYVTRGICQRCGEMVESPHIHHKDRDHFNNCIENLEVLCSKCHGKEHSNESDKTAQYNACFEMTKAREGYRITEGFKLLDDRDSGE